MHNMEYVVTVMNLIIHGAHVDLFNFPHGHRRSFNALNDQLEGAAGVFQVIGLGFHSVKPGIPARWFDESISSGMVHSGAGSAIRHPTRFRLPLITDSYLVLAGVRRAFELQTSQFDLRRILIWKNVSSARHLKLIRLGEMPRYTPATKLQAPAGGCSATVPH